MRLFRKKPTTFNQRLEDLGKWLRQREQQDKKHPGMKEPTIYNFEDDVYCP